MATTTTTTTTRTTTTTTTTTMTSTKDTRQCTRTAVGQRSIHMKDCSGVGCYWQNAPCAFCVYDMAACTQAYGSLCNMTYDARKEEGIIGCPTTTTATTTTTTTRS